MPDTTNTGVVAPVMASIEAALKYRKVSMNEAMVAAVKADIAKNGPLPTREYKEEQCWPHKDEYLTFKAGKFTDHTDDRVAALALKLKELGTCPQYSAALGLHTPNQGRRAVGKGAALAAEAAKAKVA